MEDSRHLHHRRALVCMENPLERSPPGGTSHSDPDFADHLLESKSECSSDTTIIGTRYSPPRLASDGDFRPLAGLQSQADLALFG